VVRSFAVALCRLGRCGWYRGFGTGWYLKQELQRYICICRLHHTCWWYFTSRGLCLHISEGGSAVSRPSCSICGRYA